MANGFMDGNVWYTSAKYSNIYSMNVVTGTERYCLCAWHKGRLATETCRNALRKLSAARSKVKTQKRVLTNGYKIFFAAAHVQILFILSTSVQHRQEMSTCPSTGLDIHVHVTTWFVHFIYSVAPSFSIVVFTWPLISSFMFLFSHSLVRLSVPLRFSAQTVFGSGTQRI